MIVFQICGIGSCGKSTILKALASRCEKIEEHYSKLSPSDIVGLYRYISEDRTYTIIIGSGGDWPDVQDEIFSFYDSIKNDYDIDAIFVPSRKRGYTYDNIKTHSVKLDARIVYYHKSFIDRYQSQFPDTEYFQKLYEYLGNIEVENLITLLQIDESQLNEPDVNAQ